MKKITLTVGLGLLIIVTVGCKNTTNKDSVELTNFSKDKIEEQARIDAKDLIDDNDTAAAGGLITNLADVTGDNKPEALVSIPSPGTPDTTGIIAVLIYGYEQNKIRLLQRFDGYKMNVRAENGQLVIGEFDPEGEPIVTTKTYRWQGQKFGIVNSQTDATGGGQ